MFDENDGFDIEWELNNRTRNPLIISAKNSLSGEEYDLNWTAISFEYKKIKIKIQFNDSMKIGYSEDSQDNLHVNFNNTNTTFRTKDHAMYNSSLHVDSYHL